MNTSMTSAVNIKKNALKNALVLIILTGALIIHTVIAVAAVKILGDTKVISEKKEHIHYYSRMGNFYYVNGFLKDAAEAYSSGISITPYQKDVYPVLGNIFEKLGNDKKALEIYTMGCSLYPDNEQNLLFLALHFQRNRKFLIAENLYRQIIKKIPDSVNAITCLSECLIESERPFEAIEIIEEALKKFPDNYVLQHNAGWAYDQIDNVKEALLHLEEAIRINPDFYLSRLLAGNIYYSINKKDKACEHFKEAVRIDPSNQEVYILLGELYFSMDQYIDAAHALKKAVLLGKVSPKIMTGLSWALFASNQKDESKKYLDLALKEEASISSPDVLNDLGWLLCKFKKNEQGIKFLEKAISLKPDMKRALNNLFYIYNHLEKYPETLKIAKKLQALSPDSPAALNTLGWLQFKNNMIDKAIVSFKKAVDKSNDFSLAYNNLGLMYYLKNDLVSSYKWYEKATIIKSSPESKAYAFNNMGLIDFKNKKFEKAENNFKKAIKINAKYLPALNNLGILYNTLEKDSQAEEIYNRVLKIDQGNEEAHVAAIQLGILKIKNSKPSQARILLHRVFDEAGPTLAYKAGVLLASIEIREKKYAKALEWYRELLKKNIDKAEVYVNIGNLHFKTGELDLAEKAFEKAIKHDETNITALNSLAYLLACENRDLDKAMTYAQKAWKTAEEQNETKDVLGAFSDTLGWIWFKKGDADKALIHINRSLEYFENSKGTEEILYHKALALMKKGLVDKAFECLEKAISIDPESEYGKKCKILIEMERKKK
jgi:tetratricopeptide (TPR) repeat protein